MRKIVSLAIALFAATSPVFAGDEEKEPLKGEVDETAPLEPAKGPPGMAPNSLDRSLVAPVVPSRPKKLQGSVQEKVKGKPLDASASEDDDALGSMQPKADRRQDKVLKGSAALDADALAKQDPDADDQELMIAWDRWRNRFLGAVQSNMQEEMNNPDDANLRWDPVNQVLLAKFPLGISAWFSCQISADRHIASYKLVRSSGYPNYDKAVANCVKSLEGSQILKFPNRSRRQLVTQVAGIKTSDTGSERPNFKFNDVERYRIGQ